MLIESPPDVACSPDEVIARRSARDAEIRDVGATWSTRPGFHRHARRRVAASSGLLCFRLLGDLSLEPRIGAVGVALENVALVGGREARRIVDIALGVVERLASLRV